MAPVLEQKKQDAIRREIDAHAGRILILSADAFWVRHERGLQQIREGKTVTLEQLEAKYGKR